MASVKVMIVVTIEAMVGAWRRGDVRIDRTLVHDRMDGHSELVKLVVKVVDLGRVYPGESDQEERSG